MLAGKGLYSNTIPAFGTGAAGFRRYYWREFTDQVSGTFFTEAILPTLTHEDPRYYTLGKNGFFKRTTYAFSRSFVTRNDRGTEEFNISEIGGNASEAALSNLDYPASERVFGKSAKNFATQMIITASANVLKEFWPRKTMAGRYAAKVRRPRSMAVASKMPKRTWQLNCQRISKQFCAQHAKCAATGVSLTAQTLKAQPKYPTSFRQRQPMPGMRWASARADSMAWLDGVLLR